jgi:hypothetical protein
VPLIARITESPAFGACQVRTTSDPGSGTGSARRRIASMKLKIAAFAPIPRASESTASTLKVGCAAMVRAA